MIKCMIIAVKNVIGSMQCLLKGFESEVKIQKVHKIHLLVYNKQIGL